MLDEAHRPVGRNGAARHLINPAGQGYLAAEESLPPRSPAAVVEQVRLALIAALQERRLR